jgi:phosphatidyl-myo-inositol dimannoside synthase
VLICPSFFDGRFDGIGRVSGAFFQAMTRMNEGTPPLVLSANDRVGACPPDAGLCFGRRHGRMLWSALSLRLPVTATAEKERIGRGPLVCTHLGLSPVARVIASRTRRPYAVFIHGVEAWKRLPMRSRWGVSGATRLFFNSEFTRRSFVRFNPWAESLPFVIIPLGLTLSERDPLAEAALAQAGNRPATGISVEATRGGKGFRVLIVGRMTKAEYYEGFRDATDLYKGFKQLILAIGQLAQAVPDVRLWIVGDGDARPELEAWLSTRPERTRVDFLGRVSDERLHQLYEESDVFALPSEGEGFGLVFVEAMAHRLPCVCVNAGAAPEVVQDGATGLVARPRDVDDLTDKLLVLAKNPTLRVQIGMAARRSYETNFTAEAFEGRIVAALEGVGLRR